MTLSTPSVTCEFTLDNGLKVIVREDHRTPAICATLLHKAGTRNEQPNQRGVAYITGGAAFKDKQRQQNIGALANGWLDYDVSTYSLEAPRVAIQHVLELLAARMQPPVLSEDRLKVGIQKTKEMELADPYFSSDLWITPEFESLIFPHAGPAFKFGDVDDLEQLTVSDVLLWHEQHYAPNNSVLVIVGDTSLEEVQPLVQRIFATAPRIAPLTPTNPIPAPVYEGERKITQYLDTPFPRLQMAINTPSLATASEPLDIPALQIISALLTSGPEAWIPRLLMEDSEALSSVVSRLPAYRLEDDLLLIALTTSEHNAVPLPQIQENIQALLETLKTTPLDDQTLEYGRAQALAHLESLDTLEMQGSIIGNLEVIGQPWQLIDTQAQALHSVTSKDIQRVANAWFTPERMSVAHIFARKA